MPTFVLVLLILIVAVLFKIIIVVPQQYAYIKERFGAYNGTIHAGIHFIIPFVDRIAYKHSLKEIAYDVPPQECITKDNVSIEVDGILYLKTMDPKKASYGIDNYLNATSRLAKTTLRAEIGKLSLDILFSEREEINSHVVHQLDVATDPWGIKVTRYEIKNITPPKQIIHSMEQQMRAEREKRAEVTISEGEKISRINRSMGERTEAINLSEGDKIKTINLAEGKAKEIELLANATAKGIRLVSEAISKRGGMDAVNLRILQGYVDSLGKILSEAKTTVLPISVANVMAMFEGLSKVTNKAPELIAKKEGK